MSYCPTCRKPLGLWWAWCPLCWTKLPDDFVSEVVVAPLGQQTLDFTEVSLPGSEDLSLPDAEAELQQDLQAPV